jgi:hypothetical protein
MRTFLIQTYVKLFVLKIGQEFLLMNVLNLSLVQIKVESNLVDIVILIGKPKTVLLLKDVVFVEPTLHNNIF